MHGGAEARTRAQRIDPRLRQAGWDSIIPHTEGIDVAPLRATAVKEWPTTNGRQTMPCAITATSWQSSKPRS